MAIDYASEKLYSAIQTLILADYSLRKRLIYVMTEDIGMIRPDRDLPENLRDNLREINKAATKHTSYEESINSMEDREVKELAEKIIDLFGNVQAVKAISIYPYTDYNQ